MSRIVIFFLVIFSLVFASGEPVSSAREVRKVYVGQNFTIKLKLPDKAKYPDYYYTTVEPLVNTEFVRFERLETSDSLNTYYFKAVKRGETDINIYRRKIGDKATTGLEYSILVKVEK